MTDQNDTKPTVPVTDGDDVEGHAFKWQIVNDPKSGDKRLRQTLLFTGSSPALGFRVIAACAFQDQHINFLLGENCCLHDRLIVEIDVSGVKNSLAFTAEHYSGRAEHVPRIEELER